jgi:hypothetical protein
LAVVLVTLAVPAAAQVPAAPVAGGATFLLLPVGARAAALGQAAIADAGTSDAAFWNPAGLALLPRSEAVVHYSTTFASDNTVIGGYLAAGRLGAIGLAGLLVDYGEQPVQPGPGLPVGRFGVKNLEILASYATEVTGSLLFGVNYKLIQFRQDCTGDCTGTPSIIGTTHGVDIGVQYALGADDRLRVGVAVLHAGLPLQLQNRDQADALPTRVQLGAAYQVIFPATRPTDPELDARVLFDIQDAWGEYDNPEARVGAELGYGDVVRLRTGYAFLHSESRGPSLGLGLRVGRVTIDLARIFYDSSNFDEPMHLSVRAAL